VRLLGWVAKVGGGCLVQISKTPQDVVKIVKIAMQIETNGL
jgi:hypothetical protein